MKRSKWMGNRKIIICKECKRTMKHSAHGLCQNCYLESRPKITCEVCGREMRNGAHGLCSTCYGHTKGASQSMYENKNCAVYLGIVIGESLLENFFKDITIAPPGNKGFDFVCDRGYKIDSKISTSRTHKRTIIENVHWSFELRNNTLADYFCCITIDQRDDVHNLNIIKTWLIPRDALSMTGIPMHKLTTLTISSSNIPYWMQYELNENMLNECCSAMGNEAAVRASKLNISGKGE